MLSMYYIPKITQPTAEPKKKWAGGKKEVRQKNVKQKVTPKEEADFCLNCKKASCPYGHCAELKQFLGGKRIE